MKDCGQITAERNGGGRGQKLLLHTCCTPCAAGALYRLEPYNYSVTLYFYNPNIDSLDEYFRRSDGLVKLKSRFDSIADIIVERFDPLPFYKAVLGLESKSEGGERCTECFAHRLAVTAQKAAADGYDLFATTLTTGPNKNAALINELGFAAAARFGAVPSPDSGNGAAPMNDPGTAAGVLVAASSTPDSNGNAALINNPGTTAANEGVVYLESDFKKSGGYAESLKICASLGIYRQKYCGCVFSRRPF
ncbi:MAG: epoxyqueuosine reductase QueH [Clostridiales bacterium]|jgi:predicted adenine nucleotide alpha hydrolase (AANH) superfamily ATPase|nr:epoxyqueuosine reductase QueH [Clostridiales bacterium]